MASFCSLCGVIVEMWQGDLEEADDDDPEPLNWLEEVRAVRTTCELYQAYVTGVGWLNFHGEVIAPMHHSSHYTRRPPGQSPAEFLTVNQVGYDVFRDMGWDANWCFVLHDACWELLIDRVDPMRQVPADTMAAHLFSLFYNTPLNGDILSPGHDYEHAAQFHDSSTQAYFTRVNASPFSFITGDIREQFQPDDDTFEPLIAPSRTPTFALGNYTTSDDVFCSLPSELMMLILSSLSTKDVGQLRRASRYVADTSTPAMLSQMFWSSRFGDDFEFGFVFAGPSCPRPSGTVDWRAMYLKAKAALSTDLFPGFKNRRRVWRILHKMSDALRLRMLNPRTAHTPYCHTPRNLPPGIRYGNAVYAEVSVDPGDQAEDDAPTKTGLHLSCRLFDLHSATWPKGSANEPRKLRVPSVRSNGTTYICGLLFQSCGRISEAGFCNTERGSNLEFGSGDTLEYLDILMSSKGLVGLRFHMRSLFQTYSKSVGDMTIREPSSGIGRLLLDKKATWAGLTIGLDACKVVSVALVEDTPGVSAYERREIWNPTIPSHCPLWHDPSCADQYFKLCLNMEFGGLDGELLSSLTGIVVYMGAFPAVFVGMAFIYEDGHERMYGRISHRATIETTTNIRAVQQSFLIDGPNGELMTRLSASYSADDDTIQKLTIDTNFDRSCTFRLCGKDSLGSCGEIVHTIEAEEGKLLTSLYAQLKSPGDYFRDISGASRANPDVLNGNPIFKPSTPSHRIPIKCNELSSASEMLAYPRGFAFSAADLSRVRQVRVSVEKPGEFYTPGHITGLLLDFYDTNEPAVVGQWIKELDVLPISAEDRLTEIITWHDCTNMHKRVKFGPIKKLTLRTAKGASKEFSSPVVAGMVCLSYRENPYERLTSILWGSNHEWDHVRAVYSPKPDMPGQPLIMAPASRISPTWLVREKIFLRECLEDGRPNRVTAIEVSYKDMASEPSGLTFIYENGGSQTLGLRGRKSLVLPVSAEEKLTRMDIGSHRGKEIEYISFLTDSGRSLLFHEDRKQDVRRVTAAASHLTTFILHPAARARPNFPGVISSLHEFPEDAGPFVGMWAVPKRQDGTLKISMLGPIFETVDSTGDEALRPEG
ncbi:hypothetical protein F4778DRAFT_754840 [Xylariomycetidae sp. FL2044]|nr:hypothetical protein F4778DRAFT_754840 [Xylariomycetidae sp. FL2044]